jgi:hypothetical protein
MENVGWALFLVGALVIGTPLALPILIPSLRKVCQRNRQARIAACLTFGVISFLIVFVPFTRLGSEVRFIFASMRRCDFVLPSQCDTMDPEYRANRSAIVAEIWARQFTPPPFRPPCYVANTRICELAAKALGLSAVDRSWEEYLLGVGLSLISALTTGTLVWNFTRQKVTTLQSMSDLIHR